MIFTLYLLKVNFVRTMDSSHARQRLNYLIFECIYFAYNFLRFPVVFHAVISQFFFTQLCLFHYLLRLTVICETKRNEVKLCQLRNGNMLMICKTEICNLRNGNMLMICKTGICTSVISETRIPAENFTSLENKSVSSP